MTTLPYIDPELVKVYQREVAKTSSSATYKRKESSLKHFFGWAKEQGHIETNPISSPTQITSESIIITPHKGTALNFSNFLKLSILTGSVIIIFLLLARNVKLPIPFRITPAQEQGGVETTPPPNAETLNASPSPQPEGIRNFQEIDPIFGKIYKDGVLTLEGLTPTLKAIGDLLIQGKTVTISTPPGSDGNVTISPDGKGITQFLFQGANGNLLNAQAPNLNSGSLYYGVVANNSTGYDLIRLQSGSNPITRFSVDSNGNTGIGGNLNTTGDVLTGNISRLTSAGTLQNITGFKEISGNFSIAQGGGDTATITKKGATALADTLTLTLDERGKPLTSNSDYSTLVLHRFDGSRDAMALYIQDGNAKFNGQVQIGRFASNPDAIGQGSLIFNTGDNKVYVWDGSSWTTVGSGSASNFWQKNLGALSPDISSEDVLVGATATSSALVRLPGTNNQNAFFNLGTGGVGIGTTSPNNTLEVRSTTSPQFRVAYDGSNYATVGVSSTGSTTITPTGTASGLNLGADGAGNVNLAGGSGSTGCTVDDSTGNLTCAGTISGNAGSLTQYWQLNSKVLAPANTTNDLAVGGTATSSALFQAYGIENATGNLATLTSNTITTGSVLSATASAVTSGSILKLGEGGNQTFSGNVIYADIDNTGGGGLAFTGNFLKFDNAGTTNFTVSSAGNVAVNGGSITTTSSTGNLFNATATTLNIGGAVTTLALGASTGTATIGNAALTLSNAVTLTASSLATFTTSSSLSLGSTTSLTLGGNSTMYGGTGSGGTLTISSTSNATKGNIQFFSSSNTLDSSGNLTVSGNVAANGGSLTTTATTANLFNATATTLNIGGAATTFNLGPTGSGASSVAISGGSGDTGCTIDGATGNLTCSGSVVGSGNPQGYWQLISKVLSPTNSTYDIAIGGSATSSSKFQAYGVETTSGNIASLTSSTITTGDVLSATSSAITTGNLVKLGEGGDQAFSGNVIYADIDNTGGGGGAFTGNFLRFDNAASTKFSVAASGAVTTASNLAVNGGSLTTTSTTGNLFNATATTLNIGGAGTTINLGPTGSGASSIVLSGGSSDTGCTLDGSTGNLTCSGSIVGNSGTQGFWQLGSNVISPANIVNDLAIGGSATSSAKFQAYGIETVAGNLETLTSNTITTGSVLSATASAITTGNIIKLGEGGNSNFTGNVIYGDIDNTGQGGIGFTGNFLKFDNATATKFTVASTGDITTAGNAAINGGSITTTATTANLFNTNATTLSIGGAATTALNIGNGNTAYTAINLGSGTGGNTINIAGTGATGADTINIGTGGTAADTITIGNTASSTSVKIDSGTGNIDIGTGAQVRSLNIGTGGAAQTLVLGSTTGTSTTTIQSGTGNIILQPAGTGTTANVQIGAGGGGSTTPDLLVLDIKSTSGDPTGTNGAFYYNGNTNRFRCYENSAWTNCVPTTATVALSSITAATTTNTIDSLNFAQTWGWSTLTTQVGLTLTGGTAMTTGSVFNVGSSSTKFVHTALNEVGSLSNYTVVDESTNANNGGVTSALNLATTINTSGAGTKEIDAVRVAAPTFTACTTGACTWNGLIVNTTAPTSQITVNGLNIAGSAAPASSTITGLNIGSIGSPGSGTEKAIAIGSGWDTDITLQNNETIDNATDGTVNIGTTTLKLTGGTTLVSDQATVAVFNSTSTTLNIGGAATTINLGPTGSGTSSIVLSGGSGDTGCTVAGATGNLTCSGNIVGAATGTVGYWTRATTTLSPTTANDVVSISSNDTTNAVLALTASGVTANAVTLSATAVTTGKILAITAGSSLTTGTAIDIASASYNPGAGNTGNLVNLALTNAGNNTSDTATVNGINVATTLNTSGATGTKTLTGVNLAAPTLTGCSGGSCTWNGFLVNTQSTGAASTITQNGLNVRAVGISAGSLNGINIGGITAGAGTEYALAIGSGWDRDISLASTAPKIAIGDGGTLSFTDGTNTLFSVADAGTTGNATVTGDLAVNGSNITTTTATFNLLNTNATTINLGGAATTLNIGPTGSGTSSIVLSGGSGDTGCTIAGATGNLTCSGSIATTATSGAQGWWQRNSQALSPANITDDILTGATATASAIVKLPGLTNNDAFFNLGTGKVGIGTTSPAQKLDVAGSIRLTGSFYDTNVTAGITLGDSSNTALAGFGAGSLVGALNELKNTNKNISHNDYVDWSNNYLAKGGGSDANLNNTTNGLFFDTFSDLTKTDSANTTTGGPIQVQSARLYPQTTTNSNLPSAPFRTGLINGQTYATSTTDNAGNTYLGSNTVNKVFYYDRNKDSSPATLVNLGIDPNWYNGVTLAVATTSAQFSQNDTNYNQKTNPNLSTTYNGALLKVSGSYTTQAASRTIYVTIKSPTTFDWTDYNGNSATGVTITPGTAQSLSGTAVGISLTFTGTPPNGTYNTGDVFQIASWVMEPSGSTRGAKAKFPERSYLIGSAGGLDIIDADTQKLWMRFIEAAASSWTTHNLINLPNSVTALNGKIYSAGNTGWNDGTIKIDFSSDSAYSYSSSSTYSGNWNGWISNRNTSVGYASGGQVSTINSVANDVSAAVIPNQPTQNMTVSGWGYIVVTNTSQGSETVNLPYKFNSPPVVNGSMAGISTSATAPKSLADCSTGYSLRIAQPGLIGTTNFVMDVFNSLNSNESGSVYYCYTWTATGQVSPRQYVAVATGASGGTGGVSIFNETDQSVSNVTIGSQAGGNNRWQNKVWLTSKGNLYVIDNNDTGNYTLLPVYYNAAAISSESSYLGSINGYYRVGNTGNWNGSTTGPVINGTDATNKVTSLYVTEGTSTIDGTSNTIYVGTDGGLSVINEYQSHVGDYSAKGGNELSGSVKYYTKDYNSEEMVGDIRGMWPLSANGAISMSDASVKADTLTNNNTATFITGVRGGGVSFNGTTQYLSCTDANCGGTSKLDSGGTAWSVGTWYKPNAGASGRIISKWDGSGDNPAYLLAYSSGSSSFTIMNSSLSAYGATDPISRPEGVWHFSVGTYDGSNVKLYVDGQLVKTTAASGNINDSAYAFGIGAGGNGTSFFAGSIDEPFVTATALSASQIKHMYEVGYRALQSHATTLGGGGADLNQQLGFISTGTNVVGDARVDYNNQFMYVGLNSTTLGGLSKIDLNSDTNIKTFNASANVPTGGTLLIDEDVNSVAVGYNLEVVSSAVSGVKSMAPDNNANGTSGTFYSKTQTLASNTKFAYLWESLVLDSSDGSNTITPYACNAYSTKALCDSNSAWVAGTLIQTDTNQSPNEKEYSFAFTSAGGYLTFRFDFVRGSTKTSTYISRYGATWASSVGGADIAERYKSVEPVYPGDILTVASPTIAGEASVGLAREPYDQKLVGIVTTNPGIVMDNNLVDLNFNAASRNSPDRPAVALAGRVPVKISTENGPILPGDPITSSSTPGVGMKAIKAGQVIAKAMEPFSCEDSSKICNGQITALVNVGWYDPDVYLTDSGDLYIEKLATQSSTIADSANTNTITKYIFILKNAASQAIERIGAFSELVAANIKAGTIGSDQLISPIVETKLISPLAGEKDIHIQIGTSNATESAFGKLIVENASGSAVATIDEGGNVYTEGNLAARSASFSGQLTANSVQTENATVAGELHADKIKSTTLDDIQKTLRQVKEDQALLSQAGSWNINTATSSAGLAMTNGQWSNANIENLYVTNNAAINFLSVSRSITIGSDLVVQSSSINHQPSTIDTLTAPLALQSLALAPVEIMAGKFKIDTNGNVAIEGNLAVSGNINIGGNLTASGSAQFKEVSADKFVVASDQQIATPSGQLATEIQTNATAGKAVIPAMVSEITIKNPNITDYTLVYVTPTSTTQNKVLYVKSKENGQFVVGFSYPLNIDVEFNWWVIDVAGQRTN